VNESFHSKLISIEQAASLLAQGAIGVLPTDTVYGLVACANDPKVVAKLYALKDRNHKPGTVIAGSLQQLLDLGVEKKYLDRVENWWPASLSVETPLGIELAYLHQHTGRQGLRVVADDTVRKVLELTGPLVTSSANHPGKPGATTIQEAVDYFGDEVDFYVDGGDLSSRLPSTITRIHSDGSLEIIRQGAFSIPDTYTSGKN
jgi:L-threonylcarbamoyladenylate synthase